MSHPYDDEDVDESLDSQMESDDDFDDDELPDFDDISGDYESEIDNMFEDPGGNSSLRRATPSNPRNLPCGQCGEPNRLTPKDVAEHYRCDECADIAEGHGGY